MRILTIDPGINGGLCAPDENGIMQCWKMPDGNQAILALLKEIKADGVNHCIMEKTGTYRAGNSGTAAVKFARHCGFLEGCLMALGFEVKQVSPQRWMHRLGVLPVDKRARKNKIKELMQAYYPHIKVTLALSDALGIQATCNWENV